MEFILSILGLFFVLPRLVLVVIYIFYRWWLASIDSLWLLVAGFFLAPYTMLWYCAVMNWWGGGWTWWQVLILLIAVWGDLTSTIRNIQMLFGRER